jgi:hypothetical protein
MPDYSGGDLVFTGELRIYASSDMGRCLTWDGGTQCIELWSRAKRWYGSLGAYYPGESSFRSIGGMTRIVYDEGRQDFSTREDALNFIISASKDQAVHTSDGLLVIVHKFHGAGGTLGVYMMQVLINGEKPRELPGSEDGKIRVSKEGAPNQAL